MIFSGSQLYRLSRPRKGMTLAEVLIASAILLFGMIGILALMTGGMNAHRRSVNETNATQVATSVLAELRAKVARGQIPSTISKDSPAIHPDYKDYWYTVTVIPIQESKRARMMQMNPDLGREYLVQVKVYWTRDLEEKFSIKLETLMTLQPR